MLENEYKHISQIKSSARYTIRDTQYAKAVTIIELIMAITIVGILATVSSLYIKETVDLWRFLSFRSEAVAQGRTALIRMDREIRQIKDPASIAIADLSQLRFTSLDLSGDGNDDTVEFYRDAATNELRRIFNGNPAQGNALASGIANLAFTYYTAAGAALSAPVADTTQIYRVAIEINIASGTQTKTLKAQVYPRNL